MDLEAFRDINASPERVWAALNDADILKACIDGCDSLEWSDPQTLAATVTAKVGPVKARFAGVVTLSDIVPGQSYRISGEGKGGVAGFAKGSAAVRLESLAEGATRLHYSVTATVASPFLRVPSSAIASTGLPLAKRCTVWLGACLIATRIALVRGL